MSTVNSPGLGQAVAGVHDNVDTGPFRCR
jgi:hypothetical protein